MSKPKLQLTKLKPTETNEISVVPHGANLVPRYDIVKDSEVSIEGITKEDFETRYGNTLSYEMWSAYRYSLSALMGELSWTDKDKEEKVQYLSELFTKFLNDVQSNQMLKELHEETEILKSKTQKEDTPEINIDSAKKQEKSMEKETLVQKVMAFVESLTKSEETVTTEPVADITKSKELEVQEIQKQLDESKVLIQKERDDLEVEKLAIAKEKEAIESERIVKEQEIADKLTKSELLSICKEKLSFIDGTVDENVEKLFEVKKSIEADKFEWLVKALEKKSETIENMMDESGTDTPFESDLTATQKVEKIAKEIQSKEELSFEKAYKRALDENPDLANLAFRE